MHDLDGLLRTIPHESVGVDYCGSMITNEQSNDTDCCVTSAARFWVL